MSSLLPDLERDLVQAARRQARARRRRRWRAPRGLAVAFVALLVGTTGALAATGLLSGTNDPANLHPEIYGPVVAQSVARVVVQTNDPAGGLPWGMRVFQTAGPGAGGRPHPGPSTCLQVGRLYQGQLGVLGEDGAYADDGRFHRSGLQAQDCQAQDDHGIAQLGAGGFEPRAASGYVGPAGCMEARFQDAARPVCANGRWRAIFGGLAGSDAVSVTLNALAGPITQTVEAGTDGAYLFVLAGDPTDVVTASPPYVTVTYRDGTVCPRDGAKACAARPGFVTP